MSDAPIITEKDAYEQLGNGLLALAGVMTTPGASPLAGAVALAGPTAGLVFGRAMHRFAEKRLPKFATAFLSAFDPVPEEAAKKVNAAADKPAFTQSLDDVMMRSFRQMMDAAADDVIPILGYMAGLYTFEQKEPDALFRGLGRVLCDLDVGGLEDLRTLVKLVCTFPDDWYSIAVEIRDGQKYWAPLSEFSGRVPEPELESPNGYRIFALLKREQLGVNTEPRKTKVDTPPENTDASVGLDVEMAKRIFAIVMPPGTKLPEQTAPNG